MRLSAVANGELKLTSLKTLLEEYTNDQWIGEHYTPEQACDLLLDRFKRQVLQDLDKLELAQTLQLEKSMSE